VTEAEHPHAERRERLGEAVEGPALAYAGANAQYLTGFRGEPGDRHLLVAVTPGEAAVVAPEFHLPQVRRAVDLPVRPAPANDPAAVAGTALDWLEQRGAVDVTTGPVALDPAAPYALAEAVGQRRSVRRLAATPRLRRRKDDAERAALAAAAAVTDGVSRALRTESDWVGRTERELAREIRARLHAAGATALSFPPVVASGPNAGEPSLRTTDRTIRRGDPVVVDFGGLVGGYAGDQTRTVVPAGEPPDGFEAAFEAVRAAYRAGVAAAEPGMPLAEVAGAARDELEAAGVADAMPHPLGHGVGLDAHEPLSVAVDADGAVRPGDAFSVEPGVYTDEFGVRLETVVAVDEEGPQALNGSPLDWRP